jgi:hypothetical protein
MRHLEGLSTTAVFKSSGLGLAGNGERIKMRSRVTCGSRGQTSVNLRDRARIAAVRANEKQHFCSCRLKSHAISEARDVRAAGLPIDRSELMSHLDSFQDSATLSTVKTFENGSIERLEGTSETQ